MERNCLIVSGSISVRTTIVIAMIDAPQPKPTVSWKNRRTCSNTSMIGWKMFARTNGMEVS